MGQTIYFGNLRRAMDVPAPKSGMDASSVGRVEKIDLANGGSFVSMSQGNHREFDMDWGTTPADSLAWLFDYRNGRYGTGLCYFVDPYANNALPPHWAEPGLSAGDWPSLYSPGVNPTLTPSGGYRTNWVIDPNVVAPLNWASLGSATISSQTGAGAVSGNTFGRAVATLAAAAYGTNATATFPVVAGETFALSGYVRGTTGRNIQMRITWTGATATSNTAVNIASTTAWQRLTYTGTVPAGATAARVDFVAASTSVVVGNLFEWDNVMYERGTTTVGTYFDGSYRFADGRVAAWTGAANSSASTLSVFIANMPTFAATYNLTGPLTANPDRAAVLLIPTGKTLYLGFTGSQTGNGVIAIQPIALDGTYAAVQTPALLSASATTRLNASFSSATYSAVIVYIDTTTTGAATVTLLSATAVYAANGVGQTLTGVHTPGEGHTGLRFASNPVRTYVQKRPDGTEFITAAVKFTEVGAWL